jgi:uncharacterized protein
MDRDQIIAKLRELKPELERDSHVKAIAIFGSFARDEAGPESDLDILVELGIKTPGLFGFIDLSDRLSEAFGVKVDLVTKAALHPRLRDRILGEAIYA